MLNMKTVVASAYRQRVMTSAMTLANGPGKYPRVINSLMLRPVVKYVNHMVSKLVSNRQTASRKRCEELMGMTTRRTRAGRPPSSTPEQQLTKLIGAAIGILGVQTIDADFSMTQIALRAGISKRTVYTLVSSKEELVSHILTNNIVPTTNVLDTPVTDSTSARAVLTRFLVAWALVAVSPLTVGLFVMAIRERSRFPAIGTSYYRSGKQNGIAQLSRWLKRMHEQKFLIVHDSLLVADVLLSTTASEPQRALALGVPAALKPKDLEKRIAAIVALIF
jgi:TetR/AcrR family transcriptional regulator, mexJK operon transcriptional repressor